MAGYLGTEAYSDSLVKCIGLLLLIMTLGEVPAFCYRWAALCSCLWLVLTSAQVGWGQDDVVAVVASIVFIRALPLLYKRALTLAATYPLAFAFPIAKHVLTKYSLSEEHFFDCDGCTTEIAKRRAAALKALSEKWKAKYPKCHDFSSSLKTMIADTRFTSARCFPAFSDVVQKYLDPLMALDCTKGVNVVDLDGNSFMDIGGSQGVNVCGYETYKEFIEEALRGAKEKGLFLGSLDNTVLDNIAMLQKISGHSEVSFHMSGTEAVMCAVRVARFNTERKYCVTFGGSYHGWWDGMQPVVGNDRIPSDVLCLKEMSAWSLRVIEARADEIAAIVVNPLQCFHVNKPPPSDAVLSTNNRKVGTASGYKEWLHKLRQICTACKIPLILDEVYTGFRLHPRGAQGVYDVKADIVCYGKSLGGGLPIGVVCGPKDLMARGDKNKAARINYVIGTFAGHPLVMASMNAFLKWLQKPETLQSYDHMHENIDYFVQRANAALDNKGYPIQLRNWFSVWSILYTKPGRYHWMLQYYLKDFGVNLNWVGTGRLLFSLEWQKADYDNLLDRILQACEEMKKGGWWETPRANIKASLALEVGGAVLRRFLSGCATNT